MEAAVEAKATDGTCSDPEGASASESDNRREDEEKTDGVAEEEEEEVEEEEEEEEEDDGQQERRRRAEKKVVEQSPKGRYIRYREKVGEGAFKSVYRAYDSSEGIEVAWNVVKIRTLGTNMRKRVVNEMKILEQLNHKNIISFYASWLNKQTESVVFITEFITSGDLKQWIENKPVKKRVMKRWCRQILGALCYLHEHQPPIIHRDMKCENIFVNGATGDLRVGDLGMASWRRNGAAQSVLGTPEYMAPELYEENYNEGVDVYAFGMCVLEMITKETPYTECNNAAQIYRKVSTSTLPESYNRLKVCAAADYIRLCLVQNSNGSRPKSRYLLNHPFISKEGNDPEDDLDVIEFTIKDAGPLKKSTGRTDSIGDDNDPMPKPPPPSPKNVPGAPRVKFVDSEIALSGGEAGESKGRRAPINRNISAACSTGARAHDPKTREERVKKGFDSTGSEDDVFKALPHEEEHDVTKSICVKRFEGRPDDIEDQPSNNRQTVVDVGESSMMERAVRQDSDELSTSSLPPPPRISDPKETRSDTSGTFGAVEAKTAAVARSNNVMVSVKEGGRVEAQYDNGKDWYPGTIKKINAEGTFHVEYDDGDSETHVAPQHVRVLAEQKEGDRVYRLARSAGSNSSTSSYNKGRSVLLTERSSAASTDPTSVAASSQREHAPVVGRALNSGVADDKSVTGTQLSGAPPAFERSNSSGSEGAPGHSHSKFLSLKLHTSEGQNADVFTLRVVYLNDKGKKMKTQPIEFDTRKERARALATDLVKDLELQDSDLESITLRLLELKESAPSSGSGSATHGSVPGPGHRSALAHGEFPQEQRLSLKEALERAQSSDAVAIREKQRVLDSSAQPDAADKSMLGIFEKALCLTSEELRADLEKLDREVVDENELHETKLKQLAVEHEAKLSDISRARQRARDNKNAVNLKREFELSKQHRCSQRTAAVEAAAIGKLLMVPEENGPDKKRALTKKETTSVVNQFEANQLAGITGGPESVGCVSEPRKTLEDLKRRGGGAAVTKKLSPTSGSTSGKAETSNHRTPSITKRGSSTVGGENTTASKLGSGDGTVGVRPSVGADEKRERQRKEALAKEEQRNIGEKKRLQLRKAAQSNEQLRSSAPSQRSVSSVVGNGAQAAAPLVPDSGGKILSMEHVVIVMPESKRLQLRKAALEKEKERLPAAQRSKFTVDSVAVDPSKSLQHAQAQANAQQWGLHRRQQVHQQQQQQMMMTKQHQPQSVQPQQLLSQQQPPSVQPQSVQQQQSVPPVQQQQQQQQQQPPHVQQQQRLVHQHGARTIRPPPSAPTNNGAPVGAAGQGVPCNQGFSVSDALAQTSPLASFPPHLGVVHELDQVQQHGARHQQQSVHQQQQQHKAATR